MNNLTSDILQVGQILIIKETEIPPSTNTTTYIVQKGDSLWSIANKFNTTVENLRNLNRLTSDTLQIGQELIVPNENNEEKPETTISYTVKKGDSLWKIANEYNVSVNDIINLNNLTSNILQVGQVLLIPVTTTRPPEPPIMETTYTVQRGDSLWSIANKFNTTVEKLRAVNNLTTDILQIGQILTIPSPNDTYISETEIEEYNPITNTQEGDITVVDEEAPVPELTSPLLTEQPSELQDYTTILPTNNNQIKKEETENLNNLLNTEVLQEEPTREEKEEEYHVKRGDSLWLIAKKYNTTVTNLINYNELQSINLKINDILKVPTTIQSRNYYTVQNGDTLWSIASSHNLSFQELKKINNLKDNSVTIGQKLIVNEKE
ncbi:MAG: LysM peptidoglycan-binding domain-containing protein [Bacilli bacterium]|nr:LysM peptidoglycan-binding domain-containing protein [Bacilli bacterium]